MKAKITNRKLHRWGSLLIALPLIVVIVSGILLQLKKEFNWIQPTTVRTSVNEPALTFDQIMAIVTKIEEVNISSWQDIDRIDVRPGKGIIKVRANNNWELQLHPATGEVLNIDYRRSDIIENIHDGSFFHDKVKLWVFLPTGLILFLLWVTGLYLFCLPYIVKFKRKNK